jgi:putative transposase
MRKSFKYRLRPTKKQANLLQQTLDECRWLYNQCLEQRILAYDEIGETLTLVDQHALLPLMKEERKSLETVHSQVLQNVIKRLDLGFQAFFRRIKGGEKPGFPRFRGYHRYQSFCYPQSGFAMDGNHLKLSKIGKLRLVLHRSLEGNIKTCTISKNAVGEWYVSFSCEIVAKRLFVKENVIALDVGLESFATLSNGTMISNPRFLKKSEKSLAKAQRKKELLAKGTLKRKKQAKVVSKIHNKIQNQREDFCHKESRKLINEYQTICIEDLNIINMVQESYLAKSILDVSWNRFRSYLVYKAEEAGRQLILVDPAYTSQTCSQCGDLRKKELHEREHHCMQCGYKAHRDLNASLNILALGLNGQRIISRSPRL